MLRTGATASTVKRRLYISDFSCRRHRRQIVNVTNLRKELKNLLPGEHQYGTIFRRRQKRKFFVCEIKYSSVVNQDELNQSKRVQVCTIMLHYTSGQTMRQLFQAALECVTNRRESLEPVSQWVRRHSDLIIHVVQRCVHPFITNIHRSISA